MSTQRNKALQLELVRVITVQIIEIVMEESSKYGGEKHLHYAQIKKKKMVLLQCIFNIIKYLFLCF